MALSCSIFNVEFQQEDSGDKGTFSVRDVDAIEDLIK